MFCISIIFDLKMLHRNCPIGQSNFLNKFPFRFCGRTVIHVTNDENLGQARPGLVVDIYLTSIVSGLSSGTETAGWQDEDLLRHGVDLPHALVVVDDGHPGLTDPQRNGSGWK